MREKQEREKQTSTKNMKGGIAVDVYITLSLYTIIIYFLAVSEQGNLLANKCCKLLVFHKINNILVATCLADQFSQSIISC